VNVSRPIFIDTDNACGSLFGDIDDAFALSAFLGAEISIIGISSIFGNTSVKQSLKNCKDLVNLFSENGTKSRVPMIAGCGFGSAKSEQLTSFFKNNSKVFRYAALGPLTNLAHLIDVHGDTFTQNVSDVLFIGANSVSKGRFPPVWPHEFNVTKDRIGAQKVFASNLNLTIFPLNVAKKLIFKPSDMSSLPEPLRSFLLSRSRRWILRNLFLKGRSYFPVWDLVAAMYHLKPNLYTHRDTKASISRLGHIAFDEGMRPVKLITGFDLEAVKKEYFQLLINFFSHQKRVPS
jgi:inosine-uridine nucleoside N-ribohydrolase